MKDWIQHIQWIGWIGTGGSGETPPDGGGDPVLEDLFANGEVGFVMDLELARAAVVYKQNNPGATDADIIAAFPNYPLYQDTTAQTPALLEDPVGFVVDVKNGVELGPELWVPPPTSVGDSWVDNGDGTFTGLGTTTGHGGFKASCVHRRANGNNHKHADRFYWYHLQHLRPRTPRQPRHSGRECGSACVECAV